MTLLSAIGYLVAARLSGSLFDGFWRSITATIGIFLPSFLFILIVAPILTRYRHNPNVQGFIKGAYAASIGTILGGCVLLERSPSATGSPLWWRAPVSSSYSAGRSAIPARGRDGDHRAKAFPLLKPDWVFVT